MTNNPKILQYIKLLKDFNEHTNIYSKAAYEFLDFHIQDSINIAKIVKDRSFVVDMGSGSGFPSVITAILNPDKRVEAVESRSRKCRFLLEVKKNLSLDNYNVNCLDIKAYIHQTNGITAFTAKAFADISKIKKIIRRYSGSQALLVVPVSLKQYEVLQFDKTLKFQKIVQDIEYYYINTIL